MQEESSPREGQTGSSPPEPTPVSNRVYSGKDFYSKSSEQKIDSILKFLEFLGFFIISLMVIIGVGKIIIHEFRIILSESTEKIKYYDSVYENNQQYIGDIFFVLILVEILSLIKASTKAEKLTPTFPIVIAITALVREIIKPKIGATPDGIFMLTLGIVALSGAIWIIGKSLIDEEPKGTDQTDHEAGPPVVSGEKAS